MAADDKNSPTPKQKKNRKKIGTTAKIVLPYIGAFVITIIKIRATKENTKFTKEKQLFCNGNIYFGT